MEKRKKLVCLLLSVLMIFSLLPTAAFAAEQNAFILVAEGGGSLIIEPEYVPYTSGQTVQEALAACGHELTGLDAGTVTAIDGVVGNYTRSDEDGDYALDKPASEVEYFRFSEETDSEPSVGLQSLMTAMADYQKKDEDVQAAAKDEYQTACKQFVGIDSSSAQTLAQDLNNAVSAYEAVLAGKQYQLTLKNSTGTYKNTDITAENAYGKVWTDDGDGILQLPAGTYTVTIRQDGLQVQGTVELNGAETMQADLPRDLLLKLDTFRLSTSYGAETNEETKFSDGELELDVWSNRQTTVAVPDQFIGSVYSYVEYEETALSQTPKLTAIYTSAATGELVEKDLPFASLVSGVSNVLQQGAEGNTVTYRVSYTGTDGFVYAQDYTVHVTRVPTLTGITVQDQKGVDQAATMPFDCSETSYTYKVLDTVTAVTVTAAPMDESYSVTVQGEDATKGVTVSLDGETDIEVEVSANGYTNVYTLTVQPGTGKSLNFVTTSAAVTVEVVNSNGVVMPYVKYKESSTSNRYQYTLVPGEQYSYIATYQTDYHIADEFSLESVSNKTITVDFSDMGDWLHDLALAYSKAASQKGSIEMDTAFRPDNHRYLVTTKDTEHLIYLWTSTAETDVTIQAIYNQLFGSSLYHGKSKSITLTSGQKNGEKLTRFLMDENATGNTLTIRLSKEADGVTYYQDYVLEVSRSLSLKNITAECDGMTATLIQQDTGTEHFASDVQEYSVTVSMAAQLLKLNLTRYEDNLCYGEADSGYRILVDGVDVTEAGAAGIALDGTIQTQDVTITVENDKAPNGTVTYLLHILKSPPVTATFVADPADALMQIRETTTNERIWPDASGNYLLCEGYQYDYSMTRTGYVGKSGTLNVTRDADEMLVVMDGTERHVVEESGNGGVVTIEWTLQAAPVNSTIQSNLTAEWKNFRGSDTNNGVTNKQIPTAAEDGTLYWANQIGNGIDSDAVGSPILVDGDLITYASDQIYRIDTVNGTIKATGKMDHKSSFSITPPTYADGMVFVALSNGTVQAFNAVTLESLWIYNDPLVGQPNCPLTIQNGYLYTGFWNSETGDANFVCLSITDEDPTQTKESKPATWYHTNRGGYYWAGAYASENFVMVGTDDGQNGYDSQTSSLLLLDPKTGAVLDRIDGLNGDIRSTVVYDEETDAYYFTSKGGSFYSVKVVREDGGWVLTNLWSVALQNGKGGTPMSTCSPVVYNGRAYLGVSGAGQFSNYSGHNITVINLRSKSIAYSVSTQGYPQTSGLLTTAYEADTGYVYIYFFDNATPGKLRVLRDKAGQTKADYVTTEGDYSTAYVLFTPTGDQAQYAICSPITDEYGTIYFKNDSAYLMAFGNTIEKIEITKQPDKLCYREGETFDPTGMVVTATYANGKTRDVTDYVTWYEKELCAEDANFTISFPYVMYHNVENGTAMQAGVETTTPTVSLELTFDGVLLPGDVDGDGAVTEADAQKILDWEAQIDETELDLETADVSGDGKIDSNDAVLIAQYVSGAIKAFPEATTQSEE